MSTLHTSHKELIYKQMLYEDVYFEGAYETNISFAYHIIIIAEAIEP